MTFVPLVRDFWYTNSTNYSNDNHSRCSCWLLILISLYELNFLE